MSRPTHSTSEWRREWPTVAGSMAGAGWGCGLYFMVAGVFVKPMAETFGWSRSAMTIGPVALIVSALLLPLAGIAVDRFGSRRVGTLGLAALAAGYLALAAAPPNLFIIRALTFLVGAVAPYSQIVVFSRPVIQAFRRNLGAALALVISGISLTSVIVIPLLQIIIESHGWRVAYLALCTATILIGIPAVLLLLRKAPCAPKTNSRAPSNASFGLVARTQGFWLMLAAFVVVGIPVGGVLSQLMPMLTDKGFTGQTAARFGSLFALSITGGRLMAGWLLDRIAPPLVVTACFSLTFIGAQYVAGLHAGATRVPVAIAVALLGFAQGAEADFIVFFAARYFDPVTHARVLSLILGPAAIALASGGLVFARAFDAIGTYDGVLRYGSTAYLVSALLLWLSVRGRSPAG